MMAANEQNGRKAGGHEPGPGSVRTCAGCQQKVDPAELVRVVHDPVSGELAVDLAGSSFGRGAHVHPRVPCVKKALSAGFAKAFKRRIAVTPEVFGQAMVAASARRIEGLLGGARRARLVAVGGDAVTESLRMHRAALVIVARNAAAAAHLTEVERAVAAGKAIAWGDKASLGALFGRDEVAVCSIEGSESQGANVAGLAAAVVAAYQAAAPFVGSEAWWSEGR